VGDDVGDDVGDGNDGGNNAGNNPGEGDGGDAGGEGGRVLLAEDAVVVAAAAPATAAAAAAYCRDRCFFVVKIFLCGIFMMCGGNWRGHISPHTIVMLEVCRRTFGWGRKLSSKIVVCKYQKLASKKAWQPKLGVFYTKVLGTKNEP
jgi:hypothetical protein